MSAYAAYGLTSAEDAAYAGAFEAWAKDRGWSSKEIEATFAQYSDEGSKQISSEDVLMSYRAHCDKIGLAAEHEIAAEEWLIGAAQNGLETPPLPTGQEDATRAHEIQYHEYAFCKPPPSYDVMAQVGRC